VTTTFPGNPPLPTTDGSIATPPERRAGRFYGVPLEATSPDEALEPQVEPLPELPHRDRQQQAGHHTQSRWRWSPTPADMLGAMEMQVTLGTFGVVTDKVQDALGGLRRLVRTWAHPHLYPGEPGDPCKGCDGRNLIQDCPYRSLVIEVMTEVSRGFAPEPAESR